MAANIAAMVGYAFAYEGWMALAVIPLSSLGGFTSPALNTLMSNVTPSNAQGELHGANASLGALGMMLSPLVMTQTLHAFSVPQAPVYFLGAAFLLAAALSVVAVPPFLWAMRTTPSTDAA
jgi:DHA1 family tetracycline resistance protein-like MFS transporter